jgi:general L-amino acid transport system permease protein
MSPLSSVSARPKFWRDVRVLRWVFQIIVLGVVFAILFWVYGNYQTNVARSSVPTSFGFLDNPASFTIPGTDFDQSAPVSAAFIRGFQNTMLVAIVGILFSTIVGTLVGIARLSKNFIVKTLASAYVEIIRNLPLLLLITFMNLAVVLQTFPRIEDAWKPFDLFVISNRGLALPWFVGSGQTLLLIFAAGVVVSLIVMKLERARADRTGNKSRAGIFATLIILGFLLVGWILLDYSWTLPFVDGRGTTGGLRMDPSFFALIVALVLYTSSHIAEIVRGSIQAVHMGQGEAADALALSPGQKMRIIILPQAFRIAMPSIGNQYLNLIKNSSLGATISYFELTQIAQITVGNGSPAVPAFTLTLLIYLSISLVTSLIVNFFNRRLALVER